MSKSVRSEKTLLPAKQAQALAILASGGTVSAAGRAAGVDERTVRRWLTAPSFRQLLVEAESETIRACSRRLGGLTDKALMILEGILDDPQAGPGPRLRAASVILDTALRWREQVSFADRIAALEKTAEQRSN